MAHWFRERRKRQQGGRRSTTERRGHALGSAERQPYAGAPQRGLQSPVARDPGDVACAAQALRTHQRQADSQQRLTSALWFLVFWGVRVYRLSHPPVPVATSPTAQALAEQPIRRPGAGYSWHKPFLSALRPPLRFQERSKK